MPALLPDVPVERPVEVGSAREITCILVLLVVIASVCYWPAVVGKGVLAPVDQIFEFTFFHEARPREFIRAANPLQSDPVLKFYPWHLIAREAIAAGELPLWNPYILAGTPLLANAESAVLYPINLLGLLISLPAALALSAVVRLVVAGFGMYLFTRQEGVSAFGSTVSALVFMLSGSLTVWLNYPVANAFVWLPLLFYVSERFLKTGRLVFVAALSGLTATHLFGGHLQTSFIMLVAWSGYVLYRAADSTMPSWNGRVWIRLCWLALGVTLGILIASVVLLPFQEWLGQTGERELRLAERSLHWVDSTTWKALISTAFGFVLPNLFGRPTWGSAISFFHSNYTEETVYVGIVPLALAIVAAAGGASRNAQSSRSAAYWWIVALTSLAVAVRLPVINLIDRLPFFDVVMPGRFRLICTFALAILAGIGFDRLITDGSRAANVKRLIVCLLAFVCVSVAIVASVGIGLDVFEADARRVGRVNALYPILTAAFRLTNVDMMFPVGVALAGALVLLVWRLGRCSTLTTGLMLTALVIGDLMTFGHGFNPVIPHTWIFPATDSTHFLRRRLGDSGQFRVAALNDDLTPSTASPYGLADIAGTDFPQKRYLEFATAGGGRLLGHFRITFSDVEARWLNLLAVRYLISSLPLGEHLAALVPVRKGNVYIYENPDALPRARLVRNAVIAGQADDIRTLLKASTFDPRTSVVLEKPLRHPFVDPRLSPTDSVTLRRAGSSVLTMDVHADGEALLVVADTYYPGWSATVDGEPVEILRANFAFRAVQVPDGRHVVEFTYWPTRWATALGLSIVGLLGTAVIGLGSRWVRSVAA